MENSKAYPLKSFENGHPTALVTGASSGIGVYYARELAKRGYNVLLVSNQEEAIRQTAAEIAIEYGCTNLSERIATLREEGEKIIQTGEIHYFSGNWIAGIYKNLAMPDAAERLFAFYPAAEVLVNNAGIFIFRDTAACSLAEIETLLNLHIVTVTKLCRLYGERMKARGKGSILNMSSISARTPFPGISLYTASKSYIRTFTRALGYELKEYGVKAMVVSPGAVATDLYNLPPHLQKLGLRLGIIYPPERLAKKGIAKLLKGKKEFIPGHINHCFAPVFKLLPDDWIGWIRQKTRRFMQE